MSVNFTNLIHQNHINRVFYEIGDDDSLKTVDPKKSNDPLSTVEKILGKAAEASSPQDARTLHSCAYDYIRWIEKNGLVTAENREKFENLTATTLIHVFGKEPSEDKIQTLKAHIQNKTPWYQFIQSNHIHYAVHGQQLEFHEDIAGKININGTWVDFDQLVVVDTAEGKDFFNGKDLVFKTDKKYHLQGYFYGGNQGIQNGDAVTANGMDGFFSRPATGKYWLSVYVSRKDDTQVQFGRSHSYMGMEDANGNFYYAGQYGIEKDITVKDIFTPFGEKQMGIETPDRYSSLPLALHEVKEARIEITREQYEKLTASIKRDKEKGVNGSLIKGNCTDYVRKKVTIHDPQRNTQSAYLKKLDFKVISCCC